MSLLSYRGTYDEYLEHIVINCLATASTICLRFIMELLHSI
jgi:hypothetical protein